MDSSIPGLELWLLRNKGDARGFIPPALDDHGGEVYLAYPNEAEALKAAAFQWECYEVACEPVRVL